jgi:ribosomal protein L37AE/L43A
VLYKAAHLQAELRDSHPDLRKALGELEEQAKYVAEGASKSLAEKRAKTRNSWHCWRCAVDFRNHAWTPEERAMVDAWLRKRCPRTEWEMLYHSTGSGLHFHLGRKDAAWRRRFEGAA